MLLPPRRLRRSVLTTPASVEKMLVKAAASDADYVIVDLEDSVAPAQKAAARSAACAAINELNWGSKTVAVRVNGMGTPWILDDVVEVARSAGTRLDVVVIPKVTVPADVQFVSAVLDHVDVDSTRRIGIDVLVEEALAVVNLTSLVTASTRIECVAFGPGDYAASLRASEPSAGSDGRRNAHATFARQSIVVAARAAGAVPIDGPFADFSDPQGFEDEASEARHSGFAGKWVIHPGQIAAANKAFTPTADEAAQARAICAAYKDAQDRGLGAVAVDGKMVDAANARIAEEIVAACNLIGI
jgi:citrate lyase subunit beta/citryl-CoA lyase